MSTRRGTAIERARVFLPVDRGVVSLEPVVSQVQCRPLEVQDAELDVLDVLSDVESDLGKFRDGPCASDGSIGIDDRNGDGQGLRGKRMLRDDRSIDVGVGAPAINDGFCVNELRDGRILDGDRDVKGSSRFGLDGTSVFEVPDGRKGLIVVQGSERAEQF